MSIPILNDLATLNVRASFQPEYIHLAFFTGLLPMEISSQVCYLVFLEFCIERRVKLRYHLDHQFADE